MLIMKSLLSYFKLIFDFLKLIGFRLVSPEFFLELKCVYDPISLESSLVPVPNNSRGK